MKPMNFDVQWGTSAAENYYFGGQKMLTVTTMLYQYVISG
jgi:hypothetical protein